MTIVMVDIEDRTAAEIHAASKELQSTFAATAGMYLELAFRPDTVDIHVDPGVLRIYDAEARRRGMDGAIALIESIVALWPATLVESVQPFPTDFEFPFVGGEG